LKKIRDRVLKGKGKGGGKRVWGGSKKTPTKNEK